MKCSKCGGQGAKTNTLQVGVQGLTYFEYDPKSIPQAAADFFETNSAQLSQSNAVKIEGRVADERENTLGVAYDVTFPFGEVEFKIGKSSVKAFVFGYKAALSKFPKILDKLIAPGLATLGEAAQGSGSIAVNIRKAARYRIIALALLTALKTNPRKNTSMLLKRYGLGLGTGTADNIAQYADEAVAVITRKPRYQGLAIGLAITALFYGFFYLTSMRKMLGELMPYPHMDLLLDLAAIIVGGVLTGLIIRITAAQSIKKALGPLLAQAKKKVMLPKARSSGWWGFAGSAVLVVIFVILAQTARWVAAITALMH